MSIIAHNLSAMNTSRQWGITDRKKSAIAEKLGSGYQINRAADNAAGLSISEKMRGQIRGLEQASKNIQDGISYVQVADGALNEVHSILQRMRELAVQAANDTNVDADREAIDAEIQQLKEEVDSILEKTEFNTRPVWDIHSDMKKVVDYVKKPAVVVEKWLNGVCPTTLNNTNKYLIAKDFYSICATEEGMQVSWTDYYGRNHLVPEKTVDGKEQYIPWPEPDGPRLPNRPGVKTYLPQTYSVNIADYMSEEDKKIGLDFPISFSITEGASITDIAESLDGVKYSSSYPATATLQTNGSVNGIRVNETYVYYDALLALDSLETDYGGEKISGVDFTRVDDVFLEATSFDNVIEPKFDDMTGDWEITFCNPNYPDVRFAAVSEADSVRYWVDSYEPEHEGIWWRYINGSNGKPYQNSNTHQGIGNSTLEAINYALTNSDGTNMLTDDLDQTGNGHDGLISVTFHIQSDKTMQITNSDGSKNDVGNYIGTFSMYIEVGADDTFGDVVNKMKSLQYLDICFDNANPTSLISTSGVTGKQIDSPLWTATHGINVQVGANMDQGVFVEYDAIRTYSIGLKDTNTLTRSDAGAAISEIDTAIEAVSAQRSYFGAMQNRMEHAHANADNTAENLQSSESRIRDTDMAEGMVEFSKLTILEQASQSMLSHANQVNQGILQLLQ